MEAATTERPLAPVPDPTDEAPEESPVTPPDVNYDDDGNEIKEPEPVEEPAAPSEEPPAETPADPEEEDQGDEPVQAALELILEGDDDITKFVVGGKKPTSSSIRLMGGKVGLTNKRYSKGDTVRLTVEAQVTAVAFVDTLDSTTGEVSRTERQHKARIVSIDEG